MENIDSTVELQVTRLDNPFTLETLQKYYNEGFGYGPGSVRGEHPTSIKDGLDVVLGLFTQDSVVVTKRKVLEIEASIKTLNQQKQKYESEISGYEANIATQAVEKKNLERRRDALESKPGFSSSLMPLVFLGAFLLLLTLLVFATYYYVGKATVVPMIEQALGIRSSARTLSVLFPIVALGFGFVFHLFAKQGLERGNGVARRLGSALGAFAILGAAFWLDAVMGTEMSKQSHIKEFNLGHTTVEWVDAMAWKDHHFYIVLLLGFVSYLVWGVMLHYFLSDPVFNKGGEYKNIDSQIGRVDVEIAKMTANINGAKKLIENVNKNIESHHIELSQYNTGRTAIVKDHLKMVVGKFMDGYRTYITDYYKRDEHDTSNEAVQARRKLKEARDMADKDRNEWVADVWKTIQTREKEITHK